MEPSATLMADLRSVMIGWTDFYGNWGPEHLMAAECAYAAVIRRIDVSSRIERDAIARVLLEMTSDGCLDTESLVQRCIASLYPLRLVQNTRAIPSLKRRAVRKLIDDARDVAESHDQRANRPKWAGGFIPFM
jgi:hypothetical protein